MLFVLIEFILVLKDSLLVSSDVSQKDAFHSSSTASNLGTHVRTNGVVDLMVVIMIDAGFCSVHCLV